MSEEQKQEQEQTELSIYEQNWAIHQFCGIPYHEAKKISDAEERKFLIMIAAYMKDSQEKNEEAAAEKEAQLAKDLQSQLMGALTPPDLETAKWKPESEQGKG